MPPFHVMDLLAAAAERQRTHGDLLDLLAGQPSTGAPGPVREEAVRLLARRRPARLHARHRDPELREAIAGHHERTYGVEVDPDEVVVTTGRSGGFLLAFLAAFDVGDRVAIARPGYPCYRNVLTALGCEVVEIPTGPETRFQPTVEQLAELDDLEGLVVASPANPTGTMLLPERAGGDRHVVRGERRPAGLRRDLPRHRVRPARRRRAARPQRLGDQPRGGRVLELLQVLLDDRLADRLDARAGPAAPRRRRADRQLHDLPAGARAARLPGRVRRRVVRRARRSRRGATPTTGGCCSTGSPGSASPIWHRPTARSTPTPTSAT